MVWFVTQNKRHLHMRGRRNASTVRICAGCLGNICRGTICCCTDVGFPACEEMEDLPSIYITF